MGLHGHGAVLAVLQMIPGLDPAPPRLYGDDARQSIHRNVDRQVHPHHALHDGNAVEVLEDMHGGEVAAHDALYLRCAVVVVLEGVPGEPSAEGGLYLDGRPDGDFEVALGQPAADKLMNVLVDMSVRCTASTQL